MSQNALVHGLNSAGEWMPYNLSALPGFDIPAYDELGLSYTGSNLTGVVYKASGVTIATLTLGYTDGKLTSVVKS